MGLNDKFGSYEQTSQMPVRIVQGAQYMNDVASSVLGKLTQARHYQKSTEFRGGIWDCTPVVERLISKPTCVNSSNNSKNKILSLEEILACDEEESDSQMKENDDFLNSQNNPAEVSEDASCTDMIVDLNNKRWRSEEFDKTTLPSSSDSEVTRKKSKKTVSFSNIVINLEELPPKTPSITMECVDPNGTIEDKVSDIKETICNNESKRMKNAKMVPEDSSLKREDDRSIQGNKSVGKKSPKVKNWINLVSQSSENQLPDKQHDKLKTGFRMTEGSDVACKVKNEELKNCCHLETVKPEIFGLVESDSDDKIVHRSTNKLKDKLTKLKNSYKIKNFPQSEIDTNKNEMKINSFEKDNTLKQKENEERLRSVLLDFFGDDKVFAESITTQVVKLAEQKNKVDVKSEKDERNFLSDEQQGNIIPIVKHSASAEENPKKEQIVRVRKLLEDESQYESRKFSLKKEKLSSLSIQEKPSSKSPNEKNTLKVSPNLQQGENSVYNYVSSSKSDSISNQRTQLGEFRLKKEKVGSLPIDEKPSFKQTNEKNTLNISPNLQQGENNVYNYVSSSKIDSKSNWRTQCETGKIGLEKEKVSSLLIDEKPSIKQTNEKNTLNISPNLQQGEKSLYNLSSSSKSDSIPNWRTQCIDIRQKDVTENSASSKFQNDHTNSATKTSRKELRSKRYLQEINTYQVDESFKMDYVYEEPVKVIPLNLSEPPDPSSRFKDINTDPESIWDTPEEKTKPPPKNKQIHKNESNRKDKITSIPRFYDTTLPINVDSNSQNKTDKDLGNSSSSKRDSVTPLKLNEDGRSRSHQNVQRRSFERSHSTSAHWRSPVSSAYLERDVFFVVKIKCFQDGAVEKLKILKEDFLEIKRENSKLSEIIPYPGYCRREVSYSACAVKMFVRCVFSLSYQIPNWLTALEAFSLGKIYGVKDLMRECEDYFTNNRIPHGQIPQVVISAKQLQAVEALKSSKYFQEIQNVRSSTGQKIFTPQSSVSCSVLAEPSEFVIPLQLEINRGLESCNEADVKNSLFFKSLTAITLSGIQLKFLTEDIDSCTELYIVCEVFQSKEKLFFKEFDTRAKDSIKLSFDDEIELKHLEQVEISVFIDSVLLKMFPKLTDNEFVSPSKFHAQFESSKTIEKCKLFCIEKLFYAS